MPVTVVATMKAKPESVETVRDACKKAIEAVHRNPVATSTRCTRPTEPSFSSNSGPTPTH